MLQDVCLCDEKYLSQKSEQSKYRKINHGISQVSLTQEKCFNMFTLRDQFTFFVQQSIIFGMSQEYDFFLQT